ncbi:MAG: cellulase N-terminal Ig-like domain-containing protein, partial [Bacteroidota bacterium]
MKIRFLLLLFLGCQILQAQQVHFRTNILGYQPQDEKVAFIMSDQALKGKAALIDQQSGKEVFKTKIREAAGNKWGKFSRQYLFDFSAFKKAGNYTIQIGEHQSNAIQITQEVYADYH